MRRNWILGSSACLLIAGGCAGPKRVGDTFGGATVVATGQLVRPAATYSLAPGRPVDLTLVGSDIVVKDDDGLTVIDSASLSIRQELKVDGGTSHLGVEVSASGSVWVSDAGSSLHEFAPKDGKLTLVRKVTLPSPKIGGAVYPCDFELATDGEAVVAASRANELYVVDLASGEVKRHGVDLAPYGVALSRNKAVAYVTCWGGEAPREKAQKQKSAGTEIEVDKRGVTKGATVVAYDFRRSKQLWRAKVGLQPCEPVLSPDGTTLYVPNANADTVAEIDAETGKVRANIVTKPDSRLLYGSAPNAAAISPDGKTLFVANGGTNSFAVIDTKSRKVTGQIPGGWYPSGALVSKGKLIAISAKGIGERNPQKDGSFGVYGFTGVIQSIPIPDSKTLATMTKQVLADAQIPHALAAQERTGGSKAAPVAIPKKLGDRSTIEHVVYILKENRTYDQVFGDLKQGDSDPKLCVFGRDVTPNHHSIAEQFVLLDNFYCNGVLSADGHAWSMEGNATNYFERSFGGWTRSYPFGDDPLAVSTTGFLWDHALAAGLSFRNYGEFNYTNEKPDKSWTEIYQDWTSGTKSIKFPQEIGVERLRGYSHPSFPGWNMDISEQIRADLFLEELPRLETFPNLTIIYLPQDHTSGTSPGNPTPRACVADNDLAVGRIVDALSKTKWWKKMAIFATEDDPQNGFDHVDGHRTLCLVAGPFVKRGKVVSEFYNQTSMLHTMCRILGIPPLNQMVAASPIMDACFTDTPDFTPYTFEKNRVPIDELNPKREQLNAFQRHWADLSLKQDFTKLDAANEDELNRIVWHSVRGTERYPAEWAGAHGKGLKRRGLKPVALQREEDED